jgi:phosphatidylserine/phosphatidylglycerophosphate/cardiolipin synthase-like enzyme
MFTSPLASLTGWQWLESFVDDLPKALQQLFPPSAAGITAPRSTQFAVAGNGPATALVYPLTGRWYHDRPASGIHWIWGRASDIALHGSMRTHMPLGNPVIAIRFEDAVDAASYTGESRGVVKGDSVMLDGTAITTSAITIVAFAPRAPGLDTIGVLRYLREAIVGASLVTGAAKWQELVGAMDSIAQPLRVLDPGCSPITGLTVVLGGAPVTLSDADHGDVLKALNTNRGVLAGGTTLDVRAAGEVAATSDGASFPDGIVTVTPATSHITVAPLNGWFAPQQAQALQRFTRRNTVKPFADGIETLADIFDELNKAATDALGVFYVTGYSLEHDAKLGPSGMTLRTVADAARVMAENDAEARFLALQMLQLDPGWVQTLETSAALTGLLLMVAGAGATFFQDETSVEQPSFFLHSQMIGAALIVAGGHLDAIIQKFEQNKAAVEALSAIPRVEAHLDPVDADVDDNPHATLLNPPISLAIQAQRRYNVFHQKIQIVRNADGIHAYCGGIDLKSNRLQDRDHASRGPFHDVHARVNGLAAGELVRTFVERWKDRHVRTSVSTPAGTATPLRLDPDDPSSPLAGLPTTGQDIVQVARTYYGPEPGSGRGFTTFAPNGERTILDTLLTAIPRARRYIYIEDQYLTPPEEFAVVLEAAAKTVSGPLVIVIPSTPDQPFGLPRRQAFIQRLRVAWGDRFKMGILRKRFSRTPTGSKTASGRVWLSAAVSQADTSVELTPKSRVPDSPFWLVVDGEAMRAHHKTPGISSPTSVRLEVDRGEQTHLFNLNSGTERAAHNKGAAVATGSFPDIYVHSKMMLIDDAFASIGSANCNRRGYYSDGECNIFAIRETIADGDDNWIRDLRIRLWSEHLGVTEEYGRVALVDPASCLRLFDRKFKTGNRFTSFDAQPYKTQLDLSAQFDDTSGTLAGLAVMSNVIATMGASIAGFEADHIFDTIADPGSQVE